MKGDSWIWKGLGIPRTDEVAQIRRAYAVRLRAIDSEADPEAFIALREARDFALAMAAGEPLEIDEADDAPWLEDFEEIGASLHPGDPLEAWPSEPDGEGHDLPELEGAALERIDFLLFASQGPAAPDELEALTRSILDDPAAQNIEVARWIEGWLADRIARAMPLSDPMIEPALAHFGWDRGAELNRPEVIDYILQRREDRLFEIDLQTSPGGYAPLLESMRRPPPAKASRLARWWRGPRFEYLIAYLQTFRPTVLRGLHPDTLRYWFDHIEAQQSAGGVPGWLRGIRRHQVWENGLYGVDRSVQVMAGVAALLMLAAFAWVDWGPIRLPRAGSPLIVPEQRAPVYASPAADIGPALAQYSDGALTLEALERENPALHERLVILWRKARDTGDDPVYFRAAITANLHGSYSDGLRGGSYELQSAYWQLFVDEAKWAHRYGNWSCDAFLRGNPTSYRLPPEMLARSRALRAKAVLESRGNVPKRDAGGGSFRFPGHVFEAALQRSGLDRKTLREALNTGGTPGQRCIGNIALVEAVLAQPRKVAAPILQDMSDSL